MSQWKKGTDRGKKTDLIWGINNMKYDPSKQHWIYFVFIQLAAEIWQKTSENISSISDTCRDGNIPVNYSH